MRVAAGEETLLRHPSEATVAPQLPPGAPVDQFHGCSWPKRSRKTHTAMKISGFRNADKTCTAEATGSAGPQATVQGTRQSNRGLCRPGAGEAGREGASAARLRRCVRLQPSLHPRPLVSHGPLDIQTGDNCDNGLFQSKTPFPAQDNSGNRTSGQRHGDAWPRGPLPAPVLPKFEY